MATEHILTAGPALLAQHFNAAYWHIKQAVSGTSGGRNTVWFIQPEGEFAAGEAALNTQQEWVLRHYYRGGLPGKFVRKQFIYTGLEHTRAVAEFNLLTAMRGLNLPVPKPIGAYVQRKGLTYQASILIERIATSEDLGRRLLKQPLSVEHWQQVGATIKRFHQAGVFHSDLNCKNILWTEPKNRVYLIDFDRCAIRPVASRWQQQNLARLKRSLEKERDIAQANNVEFHWSPEHWQALRAGYQ